MKRQPTHPIVPSPVPAIDDAPVASHGGPLAASSAPVRLPRRRIAAQRRALSASSAPMRLPRRRIMNV